LSKNNKNIEDLFRSNFENYQVKPSFDAWDKIDSKLTGYGFNNYVRKIFNTHNVIPSESLWPKIARKIWFANFINYQPLTFNIYNVASLSTIVILLVIGLNNKDISTSIKNDNQLIAYNIGKNSSTGSNTFVTEINTSFNENKASAFNKKTSFANYLKNAKDNSLQLDKTKRINDVPEVSETIENKYIIESHKSTILKNTTQNKEQPSTVLVSNSLDNSYKYKPNSDTVGVNALGKPIIMERERWSYDVYTALVNSQSVYKTKNKEFEKIIKDRESKQSPLLSYSVGLNINYEYYGFTLQGGLSYSQLGHSVNNLSHQDSSYYLNNYFNISDSVSFINDSLNYNDTSSILLAYNKFDSITMLGNDSSLNNKLISKNKYKYFEFPLTVSYSVKQNNFTFGVTGGLITGLFINVSGANKNNSTENRTTDLKKENPYAVPNFSSYLGFYLGYGLNQNSQIFLEPYYRKSLNSIYSKEYYFTQKFTAYGARVGLRYNF